MKNLNQALEIEETNKPEKMNVFKQLGALFSSPKRLFTYIANKPVIVLDRKSVV